MSGTIDGNTGNIVKKPRYKPRTNPKSHNAQLKRLRAECPELKRIITMGVYLDLSEYIDDIGRDLNKLPAVITNTDVIEKIVKGAKALTPQGDELVNKILFLRVKNQKDETVLVKDLLTAYSEKYHLGLIGKENMLGYTLKAIAREKKTAAKLRTYCLAHSKKWNLDSKTKQAAEKKAPRSAGNNIKRAKPGGSARRVGGRIAEEGGEGIFRRARRALTEAGEFVTKNWRKAARVIFP